MPDLLFKVHDYLFKFLVIFLSHFNYLLWRCSVVPRGQVQSIQRCSILIMLQWSIVKVFFVLWRENQSNFRPGTSCDTSWLCCEGVCFPPRRRDQSTHMCRMLVTLQWFCCDGQCSTPKRRWINQAIGVECSCMLQWYVVKVSLLLPREDHQSTCREFLLQFNDLFSMCLFYSQETMNHQCVAIQTWIINVSHNMITMSTAIISNEMLLCASLCCCWLLFVRCFGALHSIDKPKTTMMTTILHTSYAWIWNNNELIFLQQEIDFWIQQETKTTLPTPPTRRYI